MKRRLIFLLLLFTYSFANAQSDSLLKVKHMQIWKLKKEKMAAKTRAVAYTKDSISSIRSGLVAQLEQSIATTDSLTNELLKLLDHPAVKNDCAQVNGIIYPLTQTSPKTFLTHLITEFNFETFAADEYGDECATYPPALMMMLQQPFRLMQETIGENELTTVQCEGLGLTLTVILGKEAAISYLKNVKREYQYVHPYGPKNVDTLIEYIDQL